MISVYLNQTVTLKVKGSVNEYNEPTYSTSSIPARYEYKRRMVRNSNGETVNSEATCYTKIRVRPDDIITFDGINWVVIGAQEIRDINGIVSHYEAVM